MASRRDTDVNPALTPRGASVVAARVKALRAERDALRATVAALRARAATSPQAEATPPAEGAGLVADQRELVLLRERCKTLLDSLKSEQAKAKAAEQRAELVAREDGIRVAHEQAAATQPETPPRELEARPAAAVAALPLAPGAAEPAWVRARIAALGAAHTAAAKRLTALRLHVVASSTGSGAAQRNVARLEEELRSVREKLEYVDEERQHLSNEIQRLIDTMYGG